jgi:hypothetical protein
LAANRKNKEAKKTLFFGKGVLVSGGSNMRLKDVLFNWLQIQIVRDARPSDRSARDTVRFFEEMLREDHGVTVLQKRVEKNRYIVEYEQNGEKQAEAFAREAAEQLLKDIMSEPRYNQSFEG